MYLHKMRSNPVMFRRIFCHYKLIYAYRTILNSYVKYSMLCIALLAKLPAKLLLILFLRFILYQAKRNRYSLQKGMYNLGLTEP